MKRRASRALAVVALFLLVSPDSTVADENSSVFGDYWGVRVGLSYASWSALGDLEPAGRGGPFDSTGVGMEVEGYTSIHRTGANWLFGGIVLGTPGFNTSLLEEDEVKAESALDLLYMSLLAKYRFQDPGEKYIDIDAGLGYYLASSKYIDCVAIPDCFNAEADSSTLGGFVGISGRPVSGLVLGARVHFAEFGTIEAIGPDSGDLGGPIFVAYASWEFGRW